MDLITIVGWGLVAAAVLGGIAYGLIVRGLRERSHSSFEHVVSDLSAWLPMRMLSPSVAQGASEREGRPWVAEVSKGSGQTAPVFLRVRLTFDPYPRPGREPRLDAKGRSFEGPAGMCFRPRKAADRVARALGLDRAITSGDAHLDRAISVDSEAPEEVLAAFLREPPARSALLSLFEAGALHVDVLVGGETVVAAWRDPTRASTAGVFEAVRHLSAVADSVPVVQGDPVQRGSRFGLGWLSVGWAALAAAGFATMYFTYGPHPFIDERAWGSMAVVGFALGGVGAAVSYGVCRRKNRGLAHFAMSAPTALLAAIAAAFGAGNALNQLLDHGAPRAHETTVIEAGHRTYGRNDQDGTHHVVVEDWRSPGRPQGISMQVSSQEYSLFRVGDTVTVETRPGGLGWEWVSKLVPPSRVLPAPRGQGTSAPAAPSPGER